MPPDARPPTSPSTEPRLLCVSTGGPNSLDALRMRRLTEGLPYALEYFDVDKRSKKASAKAVWALVSERRPDLVYQEGAGIAAGLPLIRAARAWGQPYVISTGDPVGGFFRTVKGPLYGRMMDAYERALYRHSAGFIGWTPYLVGAALKLGAPRAVTVEGAADTAVFRPTDDAGRRAAKADVGLNPDHLVLGVVGSLTWTPRQQYCYGLELVEALPKMQRADVSILIVGDGDGRAELERRVPEALRGRVVFTGRVPEDDVARRMQAMDVGFITQTLDGLGRFRLTTKLPEYLAAGVPVAMSPVPGFFDYAAEAGWPLPARHPGSAAFHAELAAWADALAWADVEEKRARAPAVAARYFAYPLVRAKFAAFLHHVLQETRRAA